MICPCHSAVSTSHLAGQTDLRHLTPMDGVWVRKPEVEVWKSKWNEQEAVEEANRS